ncbi:MAG TPA: hypothetical protein VEG08_05145 [Terriglobales bacterium]|nr:hypothetical protein [Terriglobales bacterium]
MKPLALILLVLLPAAAQQAAPAAPQTSAVQANERQARAVLDRMLQALGGQAWLTFTDLEESGRTYSFYHGETRGAGVQYWRFWKWPDKERVELTKQRDIIEIYNGEQGWETTYKGTHNQEAKELALYQQRRRYSLAQVLRTWLTQPGLALFYDGASLANGRPVEQVTLMNAQDESVTLYVSSESHLPLKLSYRVRDPLYHDLNTESVVWDNYHPVQGIQTPYSVTFYHNDEMAGQRFVNAVRYNLGLADSQFTATVTTPPLPKKH